MKKLTLSILMLVTMFMIANSVSAGGRHEWTCDNGDCLPQPNCQVIVTEPQEGHWYDPVAIMWHYDGTGCNPFGYLLAYQPGTCNGDDWHQIAYVNPDPQNNNVYEWNNLPDEGDYCIGIQMNRQNNSPVIGYSGPFHLDLTDPVLTISVGEPKVVEEEETYVNQQTLITLSCTDAGGSGVDYIEYWINEEYQGYYEESFTFEEDSEHFLEARCVDNVGKYDEKSMDFIVETVGPELDRTVGEPSVPAEGGYYVTQDTEICVSATDPQPHPVPGEITIECQGVQLDDNNCFHYTEDSEHTLYCSATDALGNTGSETWNDLVDTQAPIINVEIGDPKFPSQVEGEWYVSIDTEICVSATDPQPHPVGGTEVSCLANEDPIELDENGCFEFTEESYHTLNCVANDALENEAQLTKGFIVDDTAPLTHKNVGAPSHDCSFDSLGRCEDDWDWIVTMDTEITLSCEDQNPHPSGISSLCYRVTLDGNAQEWVCEDTDEVIVHFAEESEHLLEFYCVDNVNKTSEIDSELFKVEGEEFAIPLYEKWNLISIPFNLLSNNIEEVFDQISDEVEIVWSYDEDGWHVYSPEGPSDLTAIEPGYGYWVRVSEDTELVVGGSLLSPGPGVPPSRDLQQGWNLIGRYGLDEDQTAYCALFSLVDTTIGHPRWSALYSYDAEGINDHFVPLDVDSLTNPGEGYWIEMDVEDTYSPATVCWGFPNY